MVHNQLLCNNSLFIIHKRNLKRKYLLSVKTKQTSMDIYGTRPGTRVSEETLIFDHKRRQTLSSRVNSTVGYLKKMTENSIYDIFLTSR